MLDFKNRGIDLKIQYAPVLDQTRSPLLLFPISHVVEGSASERPLVDAFLLTLVERVDRLPTLHVVGPDSGPGADLKK